MSFCNDNGRVTNTDDRKTTEFLLAIICEWLTGGGAGGCCVGGYRLCGLLVREYTAMIPSDILRKYLREKTRLNTLVTVSPIITL